MVKKIDRKEVMPSFRFLELKIPFFFETLPFLFWRG